MHNHIEIDTEAKAIELKGLAEAQAIEKKAEAQKKMGEASVLEMYLNALLEVVKNAASPLAQTDKIVMYGDGNSTKVVKDVMNSANQVFEGMKESTGLDLQSLITGVLAGKALTVGKTYSLNARRIQSTKTTTSDRVLHLRPELLETVRECVTAAREKALVYGFRPRLLFADAEGGYISYEAYSKYFRENTERIVGRRLSVHSLRHTYTSLMAEAGLPLDTISRTLGHADSKITREIYLHVTEKMREKDAARLDAVSLL